MALLHGIDGRVEKGHRGPPTPMAAPLLLTWASRELETLLRPSALAPAKPSPVRPSPLARATWSLRPPSPPLQPRSRPVSPSSVAARHQPPAPPRAPPPTPPTRVPPHWPRQSLLLATARGWWAAALQPPQELAAARRRAAQRELAAAAAGRAWSSGCEARRSCIRSAPTRWRLKGSRRRPNGTSPEGRRAASEKTKARDESELGGAFAWLRGLALRLTSASVNGWLEMYCSRVPCTPASAGALLVAATDGPPAGASIPRTCTSSTEFT